MASEIFPIAEKIINEFSLCDSCLGRLFRGENKKSSNKKKGQLIRDGLKINNSIDAKDCWLCEGLSDEITYFRVYHRARE